MSEDIKRLEARLAKLEAAPPRAGVMRSPLYALPWFGLPFMAAWGLGGLDPIGASRIAMGMYAAAVTMHIALSLIALLMFRALLAWVQVDIQRIRTTLR